MVVNLNFNIPFLRTYSNFNLPDRANLEENSDGSEGYEDSSSEEHAQDLTEGTLFVKLFPIKLTLMCEFKYVHIEN